MTSFSRPTECNRPRRRGFTLVEMLVVVGIIVVLISILMPAINKAHTRAIRARMQLDVQTLVAAMESYKADMRDYPHIDYTDTSLVGGGVAPAASNPGAVTLCSALVGPGSVLVDGYGITGATSGTGIPPGAPGFTIRPQGQVYGPYVDISRFKFVQDATMLSSTKNAAGNTESNLCLADRYNHPILYFKANINSSYRAPAGSGSSASPGFVADYGPSGPTSMYTGGSLPYYNYEDNPIALRWPGETDNSNGVNRMEMMLGDKDHDGWIGAASTADGAPENPNSTSPYLIWSAGPDELFCFDPSDSGTAPGSIGALTSAYTKVANSDDAHNFGF